METASRWAYFRDRRQVILTGPQANRLVLLDEDANFSSRWGWDVVHDYFARMVLVRDFEDHRQHRRIMTGLFKSEALKGYLSDMEPIIETSLEYWHGEIEVYARQKRLALDIALRVFCGFEQDSVDQSLYDDLSLVLDNVLARRSVLPWTRSWRARRARDRVRRVLQMRNWPRAGYGDGTDLFSRLATETDDQGRRLADADVVDHMIGMLFAAHDTTASSLTMICLKLAESVEWQGRLRAECREICDQTGRDTLAYESLDACAAPGCLLPGGAACITVRCSSYPEGRYGRSNSTATEYPPTHRSCSCRRRRTSTRRTFRSQNVSIPCGSSPMRGPILSPSFRSAAAATCALACTLPPWGSRRCSTASFFGTPSHPQHPNRSRSPIFPLCDRQDAAMLCVWKPRRGRACPVPRRRMCVIRCGRPQGSPLRGQCVQHRVDAGVRPARIVHPEGFALPRCGVEQANCPRDPVGDGLVPCRADGVRYRCGRPQGSRHEVRASTTAWVQASALARIVHAEGFALPRCGVEQANCPRDPVGDGLVPSRADGYALPDAGDHKGRPYEVSASTTASTQASALARISSSVASWIGCATNTRRASFMPRASAWAVAASTNSEEAMLTEGELLPGSRTIPCHANCTWYRSLSRLAPRSRSRCHRGCPDAARPGPVW